MLLPEHGADDSCESIEVPLLDVQWVCPKERNDPLLQVVQARDRIDQNRTAGPFGPHRTAPEGTGEAFQDSPFPLVLCDLEDGS